MDELIRTAAISPLRQRLIDDMNMRRFSRETQRNYIRDVARFATSASHAPASYSPSRRPPMTTCRKSRSMCAHHAHAVVGT